MARTEPVSAQPLPGSEADGTIAIDVAAKLLMVTPESVRRLTKGSWIARTERGRYRVVEAAISARKTSRFVRFFFTVKSSDEKLS